MDNAISSLGSFNGTTSGELSDEEAKMQILCEMGEYIHIVLLIVRAVA